MRAELRQIRFPRPEALDRDLLLEQGVELVVIKERLGHAHIGVTAAVYAYLRPDTTAKPSTLRVPINHPRRSGA
ncbi:hypothetical protein ACI2L5_49040 [Streptomyces milbemycinicus]|uniref:Integrase n=1 Tax=Streptomyces milbemycinicus TaxID=476552 RepID=A0ABW8M3K9_9ACTN